MAVPRESAAIMFVKHADRLGSIPNKLLKQLQPAILTSPLEGVDREAYLAAVSLQIYSRRLQVGAKAYATTAARMRRLGHALARVPDASSRDAMYLDFAAIAKIREKTLRACLAELEEARYAKL
jgi:hypothetical protein